MELKPAIKEQFRGAFAMLRECVIVCPADIWTAGKHPRTFWRIALHAAYFTHLYLGQSEDAYTPWPNRPKTDFEKMWLDPRSAEPYELPESVAAISKEACCDYIEYLLTILDGVIDELDLTSNASGFDWYPKTSKLSHCLMNLRHLQGHIGQLSEILMMHGVDTDWISAA